MSVGVTAVSVPDGGCDPNEAVARFRFATAVLSGLLLLASFPPVDAWWAAPIGLAVLLRTVQDLGCIRAWWLATVAYVVLFLPLLEWVRFLGLLPWLALVVLQAALAGLLGPLVVLLRRSAAPSLLSNAGIVGAVIVVEGLRARVPFGGLTWGRLAFGETDGPLLPWAAVGGAPLVSAVTAVVALTGGAAVAQLTHARRAGVLRAGVGAATVIVILAAGRLISTSVTGPVVSVVVVQGNVPRSGVAAFAEDLVVLDNHVRVTEQFAADVAAGRRRQPDLVIWPENASDQDPRSEPQSRARLERAERALGQPFLLGAVLDERGRPSNALLVWGPTGPQGPIYRKRHLVPFGEYLPFRALVSQLYPSAKTLLARDFVPGHQPGSLTLRGVRLAVGTCFEVAFDSLSRQAVQQGGELLVLPSNNASYGRSAQSAQQLAMARLRAVEHSRSTVVATTSGISALIAPDGRVIARSALYTPALLQADLPRRTGLTWATRYGAAAERALAALILLPLAARRLARLRERSTAAPEPAEPE